MNGQTTIYALADPRTGEIRYVGKTVKSLNERLSSHVRDSLEGQNHRNNWIRSLKAKPTIRELLSVPNALGSSAEQYAIAIYRSMGYRLTNLTDGGEGCVGRKASVETRAKLSASLKGMQLTAEQRARQIAALTGRRLAPQHIANIAAGTKGKKPPPVTTETRLKMSIAHKGKPLSAEHRAKVGLAGIGRKHTAEARANMSVAQKNVKRGPLTPEHKANISAANTGRISTPETRAKISAGLKGNKNCVGVKHTLETRAKLSAARMGIGKGVPLSAERKAKMSIAQLARHGTHCANGHEYTPENTKVNGKGHRSCRICQNMHRRAWYQRSKSRMEVV